MRGKIKKKYIKDQIIHNGPSQPHPGTHGQEHPPHWWHLCRVTAGQCHTEPSQAAALCPPCQLGFCSPFPWGNAAAQRKGKCCSVGQAQHPQMGREGGPSTPGHPSKKRHPKVPPFPSHLVPSILGCTPVSTQGVGRGSRGCCPNPGSPGRFEGSRGSFWGVSGNREVQSLGAFIGLEVGEVSAGTARGDTGVQWGAQ